MSLSPRVTARKLSAVLRSLTVIVVVFAALISTPVSAQQLILNPGAEESIPDDTGGGDDIADWLESPATVNSLVTSSRTSPGRWLRAVTSTPSPATS